MSLLPAVRATVSNHWGRKVSVESVLVDHFERVVFTTTAPDTGATVVIKTDVDGERTGCERRGLAAFAAAGIPAPRLREVIGSEPEILVLSWIDGQPLGSASTDAQWGAVAAALRQAHDHGATDGHPPFWADMMSYTRSWLASGGTPLADRVADHLRDLLDRLPAEPPARLLHGDCGPYHWLLRGDAVAGAIDFGDCGLGDPAWDLAVLTLWDHERIAAVLAGYRADPAFRRHFSRVLPGYLVIRHVGALEWLVSHDVDPAPTVRELNRLAGLTSGDWDAIGRGT